MGWLRREFEGWQRPHTFSQSPKLPHTRHRPLAGWRRGAAPPTQIPAANRSHRVLRVGSRAALQRAHHRAMHARDTKFAWRLGHARSFVASSKASRRCSRRAPTVPRRHTCCTRGSCTTVLSGLAVGGQSQKKSAAPVEISRPKLQNRTRCRAWSVGRGGASLT